jgi:hypothetical protein
VSRRRCGEVERALGGVEGAAGEDEVHGGVIEPGGGGHRRRRSQRALATLEVSTPRCGEADWALGVVERQVGVVLVTAEVGGVERAASVAGVSDLFKIRAFFFGRGVAGCVLRPAGMDWQCVGFELIKNLTCEKLISLNLTLKSAHVGVIWY